jgi:GNAT superfamily N-acetyltransferase
MEIATADINFVTIRAAAPSDHDFVQGTLLNHYYEESFWAQRLTTRTFFDGHTPLVKGLLYRAQVNVACEKSDPYALLGFVIFEPSIFDSADLTPLTPPVLDFLFVKKSFRGIGIGRLLFESTGFPADLQGVHVSFATKAWFTTKKQKGLEERFHAKYDPYLQWRAIAP